MDILIILACLKYYSLFCKNATWKIIIYSCWKGYLFQYFEYIPCHHTKVFVADKFQTFLTGEVHFWHSISDNIKHVTNDNLWWHSKWYLLSSAEPDNLNLFHIWYYHDLQAKIWQKTIAMNKWLKSVNYYFLVN